MKKCKLAEVKVVEEQEPSGLDALATVAVLGESIGEFGESSSGPTTRHPRHRPGCTCIVCIQPPSGKGKHKPNCFCNVCLTVKRRFKTLMLRKKKRLSDKEAEVAQKSLVSITNGLAPGGRSSIGTADQNMTEMEVGESSSKGGQQLDLNCDPDKEEGMMQADAAANASGIPIEWQNVLAGLVPCSQPKSPDKIEEPPPPPAEDHPSTSPVAPTHPPTDEIQCPMDDTAELETAQKVTEDG